MIGVAVILEWYAGRLPFVALLIPLRDVLLMAVTPYLIARGYRFEVNFLGKAATWLLYLGVGCSIVTRPVDAVAALDLLDRLRARRSPRWCCTRSRLGES